MDKEIYFAGGCFWGTEHFFKQINGVTATQVGYANGNIENPTYEQVYTDSTGFAEVVKVAYDPKVVSLEMLLDLFFKTIDPTSLNQQGEDIGTRYRTGIYWGNSEDEKVVFELLKTSGKLLLDALKEQSGFSNKKWDKTIKGLTSKKVAKVIKENETLLVEILN